MYWPTDTSQLTNRNTITVMPCAKYNSDHCIIMCMTANEIFIAIECEGKPLVKWDPGHRHVDYILISMWNISFRICTYIRVILISVIYSNLINNTFCTLDWWIPDNKVHGASMGPIWGRQDPGGPYIGPMNFSIWDVFARVNISAKYRFSLSFHWDISHICETGQFAVTKHTNRDLGMHIWTY